MDLGCAAEWVRVSRRSWPVSSPSCDLLLLGPALSASPATAAALSDASRRRSHTSSGPVWRVCRSACRDRPPWLPVGASRPNGGVTQGVLGTDSSGVRTRAGFPFWLPAVPESALPSVWVSWPWVPPSPWGFWSWPWVLASPWGSWFWLLFLRRLPCGWWLFSCGLNLVSWASPGGWASRRRRCRQKLVF